VDGEALAARLNSEAAERQVRLALVRDVLDSPQARRRAGLLGLEPERLRAAVPHLSADELKELSVRAQQVKDVLAAGHEHEGSGALALVGLLLVVAGVVVLLAVAEYDDDYYDDDCYCY